MDDVYYTYGDTGSGYNRAGRVYKTDNGTVSEELYFGKLGETVKTVRTINDGDTTSTYTTKYAFDNLGRMRTLTYPDGEILTYSYGKGGLLKSATGETSSGRKVYLEDMKYDEFGQRTYMKYGNGAESTYTYEPVMRRLTNLKTTSAEGKTLQNIAYQYDEVGNILSRRNSEFNTTDNISRNSEQSYTYDNRDRLTSSGGKFDYETWNPFWNKRVNTYSSDFEYNITGKILRKNQENKGLIEDTGETVTIGETTYVWNYEYGGAQPNAVTKAGTRTFSYDLNGNMTTMMDSSASLNRTLLWDEENRLKKTTDTSTSLSAGTTGTNSIVTTYGYGADGMRAVKKGKYGTVQYVSENYVVRNKDLISKHVFAGNTRLVSNMVMREEKSGKMVSTEQGCYYYHADHLGSSSVVTDKDGKFYEQIEYFPYGETWVHNKAVAEQESTPYKFTSKELDPETGLYYFGARYYDGKLSRWTAADPPLAKGDYLPKPKDFDTEHDYYWYFTHDETDKLPGMGGVFNTINIDAYQYAGQNPVKLVDPDGEKVAAVGSKTEIAAGPGFQFFKGYLIQYGDDVEFSVYEISCISLSAGIRADTGADLTFYASKTIDDWVNTDSYMIFSGDIGIAGTGVGSSTGAEKKGAINASGGGGAGASFSVPNTTHVFKLEKADDKTTNNFKAVFQKIFGEKQVRDKMN